MDRDASSTDEYFVTAVQIFDYCGADSGGTLRVDALMEKFAPFIKTNKSECSYLKSLLDPGHCNPEINVAKLAMALSQYSESQKGKVDLDESFNLKSGPMDSDSGISTDGFQLLEDLQCELREKAHLAHQLRSQLDFTDRQHEEALATLTAERDSLRAHLNMLREENMTLTHVRRDYEEACERLCGSEQALAAARRDRDTARRTAKALREDAAALESEKLTLQELLAKSKDECHRINEMYASRQSALREENETLKTEHADLSARLQDQDEILQQIIKEKAVVEMELKEMLSRHNQSQRFDRSIDVSYTDDQMLSALDTLSPHTRFTQDVASVSTQADVPCASCALNKPSPPARGLRRYLWEAVRRLVQVFAVVCFMGALCVLYGVTVRARCGAGRGARGAVPWRWLDAQEIMDLLLRIEYVADVPM